MILFKISLKIVPEFISFKSIFNLYFIFMLRLLHICYLFLSVYLSMLSVRHIIKKDEHIEWRTSDFNHSFLYEYVDKENR